MQEATLVLGMILQRFHLFDHAKYQLKIKETLSIKPEGFRIRARLRPTVSRTRVAPAAPAIKTEAAPEKTAARPQHGSPLYVLYGSNLGATEAFAREIAQAGDFNGFKTQLAPLDDFAGHLPTDGPVVIASASYNGAPPDNAVKFADWLQSAPAGAASGVSYAVFGCGNRDWASTFQAVPRLLDEKLEALGGRRLLARGEADARDDLDGQFLAWFDPLFPKLGQLLGLDLAPPSAREAEPLYRVDVVESVSRNPVANQTGARIMRVLENRELQDTALSGRSTRHVEIELPAGVTYRPGDHLCVVPPNREEIIDQALARFGFRDEDHVRITATGGRRSPFPSDSAVSVRRIAEVYGELQTVASRKDVATLARHTRCPITRAKLEALAAATGEGGDAYRAEVFLKRRSILDLLEEFPAAELPFHIFLEMIPWMAPRYYSISSSPRATPGRCSITVGVVEGPARSGHGVYKGVCSSHLARARVGDAVQAVVKETKAAFRLPDDAARPIIMIGPGTGLAPFRAFLQERKVAAEEGARLGPAMLFFGCRKPDHDYLYKEDLEAAAAWGLVDLHVAFSRAAAERVYVQDLLRRERAKVWRLLEEGAIVYVCGDGARMEPDVRRALATLYAEERGLEVEGGDAALDALAKADRYVLDVWAGGA